MVTDRHGFLTWSAGFTQSDTILNDLLDKLEVKVGLAVVSRTTDAQPGGPGAGDCYIMTATPSGAAWSTFNEHDVAIYRSGAWVSFTPISGWLSWVEDDANGVMFNGTSWVEVIGASEFADNVFRIQDNGDVTKELAFEVSAVAAGTTRTVTMPNKNVDLSYVADEVFTCDVATVADQDYVLWYDAPWPGEVTKIRTESASGTCTLTGKVNTTALGGTANSVSSTAQEQAHSSTNTFVKGDKLQFTVSSNAACLTMAVAFYLTRTGL